MGGGYEADQDSANLTTDTIGNSIYIVDSETGALLWHGSRAGRDESLRRCRASDGLLDSGAYPRHRHRRRRPRRSHVRRRHGRPGVALRHHTTARRPAISSTGGVIAQLGGAPSATPAPEDIRRFYNAPDVAFINTPYGNFIHVGIGSGHRGHPLEPVRRGCVLCAPRLRHGSDDAGPVRLAADHRARRPRRR